MKKRILAALLALGCALLVFTGCGSKKDTTPKDYTQIIHPARGQLHRSCRFPLFHDGAELRHCHRQAC